MIALAGGTFLMGSDRDYPEEAPAHRVSVSPFRIDATPVTNARFRAFVAATSHVTQAEIAPRAEDYPGARPEMLQPASLTFRPPAGRVSLSQPLSWWDFTFGANWRRPYGKGSDLRHLDHHPVVHVRAIPTPFPTRSGPARICQPKRSGSSRRAVASRTPTMPGAQN